MNTEEKKENLEHEALTEKYNSIGIPTETIQQNFLIKLFYIQSIPAILGILTLIL